MNNFEKLKDNLGKMLRLTLQKGEDGIEEILDLWNQTADQCFFVDEPEQATDEGEIYFNQQDSVKFAVWVLSIYGTKITRKEARKLIDEYLNA